MSYKIARSEGVKRALRRAAAGEVKCARKALQKKTWRTTTGAVHEARKRFKKIRALLRLARPGLGKKQFKEENVFFRDAGRRIREVRDRDALIQALDEVSRRSFDGRKPRVVSELRGLLMREVGDARHAVEREGALVETARELSGEIKRVKGWRLRGFTRKSAREAGGCGWKACQKAYEAAAKEPTDENLHEWRKRTKCLLFEILLLGDECPELGKWKDEVERLGAVLGAYRDLAMLVREIDHLKGKLRYAGQIEKLLGPIKRRRERLRREALATAKRWYGNSEKE